MLNFDAFNIADIQNCLHLLNELEGAGVTDVRFARERLATHVQGTLLARHRDALLSKKPQPRSPEQDLVVCPECGAPAMVRTVVNGEVVDTCRMCRWSRYVEEHGRPS
jgi:hypothetical protein